MRPFRFALLFALIVFVSLSAAAYEAVLLGDLHYDRAELHHKTLSEAKQREQRRNVAYWANRAPKVIAAAAAKINARTAFAMQLGDIVQGDTDAEEDQATLCREALGILKKHIAAVPLYFVKGNHDHRCPGGGAASERVIPPSFKSEKLIAGPNVNYAFLHENDLFLCFDSEKPDLAWIKKVLAEHPDVRHTFVFTHLPVLPCSTRGIWWLIYNINPRTDAARLELRKLLAARDAIVICAHTHKPSLMVYRSAEGRITQAVVSSMAISGAAAKWTLESDTFDTPALQKVLDETPKIVAGVDEYRPGIVKCERYQGSGFAVLRVEGEHVFLDCYAGTGSAPAATWQLR